MTKNLPNASLPAGPASGDIQLLRRIAEAAAPPGAYIDTATEPTIHRVYGVVVGMGDGAWVAYMTMARALDLAAIAFCGRRLSKLPIDRRIQVLARMAHGGKASAIARAVTTPIKLAQAESPALLRALGVKPPGPRPAAEKARWHERVSDARDLPAFESIEVDAVVVGTGAGGAPVARRLAAAGHAVLMLEEGGHFTRPDFHGAAVDRQQRLFRNGGLTTTVGNAVIPVPLGKTLGGTTTVNSGTCFRLAPDVMKRWQDASGLDCLRPGSLDSYYEQVERMLQVEPARPEVLSGSARAIARGCDALGFEYAPLARNAPGCDGQGTCCFGCPTDAKRSTNVSYVPAALEQGAMVFTHARVVRVLMEGGRAVGVEAHSTGTDGTLKRLIVRAAVVVLACGSIQTPALLLRQKLANRSGQVGRNLTIHPASYAWARFDDTINGWRGIPQGLGVDEFVSDGIRFEGGYPSLGIAAATLGQSGHAWTELVEDMGHLACFGFMIADSSRGRVVLDPAGAPRMTYWLNKADRRRLVRGHGLLARMFLAAGATAVHPGLRRYETLRGISDVERMEREAADRLSAMEFDLTAYHPLGTCRMGVDPRHSVVDAHQECHDVPHLFLCDGSTLSGPLGVNPQLTIMAMSERAADAVGRRIEGGGRAATPRPVAVVSFKETMAGTFTMACGPDTGESSELAFHVEARLPVTDGLEHVGCLMELRGTLDFDGVSSAQPCTGTLQLRPLEREGTMTYDLGFTADDGMEMRLFGRKHVDSWNLLGGMTQLHTDVHDADGTLVATGLMRFDLRDLPSFAAGWRLGRPRA
jgi:choline dehydrogenase-like flavoprotein